MEAYIVRQPIVNDKQVALGYEILYHEDNLTEDEKDSSAANAIENFLSEMDGDRFLDSKPAFLTFTRKLLVRNIPRLFPKNKLVIQIEDSVIVNPLAYQLVLKYKKQGFKVAVVDFEFAPRYFSILDVVDYIKVNFKNPKGPSLESVSSIGSSFGKTIIAYNVNTPEAMERAKLCGCHFMQGSFVAEQMPSTIHKTNHLQSNFFMLMVAITKDEPDLDEIEELISRDVTLTFSLLRLVNSAYFALREKAKSVKQALVVLGLGQLKQWIYLLSFKQDDGSMPDELIKTSFLRGSFASELLPYCSNMPIAKSEAYLLGMFSTLGALMQIPISEALSNLAISDDIKDALIGGTGRCGVLYNLLICYEKADWKAMNACAEELGVPLNIITQTYFECVETVNTTWNSLMNPHDHNDGDSRGLSNLNIR